MGNRNFEAFVRDQWSRRRSPDEHPILSDDSAEVSELKRRLDKLRQNYIMSTGLAGECGEVVELLKKNVRDGAKITIPLALELGDVLYYLTRIALEHGLDLEMLQQINQAKLMERRHQRKDKDRELALAETIIDKLRQERMRHD